MSTPKNTKKYLDRTFHCGKMYLLSETAGRHSDPWDTLKQAFHLSVEPSEIALYQILASRKDGNPWSRIETDQTYRRSIFEILV
jgi:hypothetical protein